METVKIGGHEMILRDVNQADMKEVLSLHQRVFSSKVDESWYEWKYVQGGGEGVGIWHAGRLIAHCGGLPRDILHYGMLRRDLQIGDVMVDPEWRGILTRQGPFFHVSRALYDSRLGNSKRFYAGFGFPNARALGLGVRSGLSQGGGNMMALNWSCSPKDGQSKVGPSRWIWRVSRLTPDSREFDSSIDEAWANMRSATQGHLIGERHATYVRWRFANRPEHEFIFLQLRRPWQTRTAGVAVLTATSATQSTMHWLDWIGSPDLMAAACSMCLTEASRSGAAGLTAWASNAVLEKLASTGIAEQSEVAVISVANASAIAPDQVDKLNWWLMGGDTDFL